MKRGGEEGEEEEGLVDRLKGLSPETRAFFDRKDEAERRLKELQVGGWVYTPPALKKSFLILHLHAYTHNPGRRK